MFPSLYALIESLLLDPSVYYKNGKFCSKLSTPSLLFAGIACLLAMGTNLPAYVNSRVN